VTTCRRKRQRNVVTSEAPLQAIHNLSTWVAMLSGRKHCQSYPARHGSYGGSQAGLLLLHQVDKGEYLSVGVTLSEISRSRADPLRSCRRWGGTMLIAVPGGTSKTLRALRKRATTFSGALPVMQPESWSRPRIDPTAGHGSWRSTTRDKPAHRDVADGGQPRQHHDPGIAPPGFPPGDGPRGAVRQMGYGLLRQP